MLALLDTQPTFFMDKLVNEVIDVAALFFEKDITRVALGVFFFCLFFHLVQGAGELAEHPHACRFFKTRWWMRMAFCLALLMGYRSLFEGFARSALPTYMSSFAGAWLEIWDGELDAKDQLQKLHQENQDVKKAEVTTTRQGEQDQAWWSKAMSWTVDALITALGIVLSTLAGMFVTVLILVQGFWVLGINAVILGLGPLCIAFLAHEATEGIFWVWAKAWLVYGLLFLPALGLGARMAGAVFRGITDLVAGSGAVFGDGSDIAMHFIYALLGPLCCFAVVQAIPAFLSQLLMAAVTSHGSSAVPSAVSTTAAAAAGGQGVRSGQMWTAATGAAHAARFEPSKAPDRTAVAEALGIRPGEGGPA
jgi:hypothetical protein